MYKYLIHMLAEKIPWEEMKLRTAITVLVAMFLIVGLAGVGSANGLGKYKDVDKAVADGYGDDPGEILCVPNMGIHYIDGSLIDGEVNVGQPESLVYAQTDDGLLLLGVEYLATEEFSLFRHHAHAIPGTPWYGLHSWFFVENDNGKYAELHSDVDENCNYVG